MAKSSKKSKHQDFQKVKLKAGRKLPKGLNDTSTVFKSSSIVIKHNVKEDGCGEGSSKHKPNLKELLAQSKHHNVSVRVDAINGLRSLIEENEELINTDLANIIECSSETCLDREAVVRKSGLKLYKNIIEELSSVDISPFFNLISAHLNCAMTHIDEDIQFDSLKMLDLCLENFPELVICTHSKLMPNFIEQISFKNISGGKRSLLISPGSKLSTQKWRVKVLNRLYSFLLSIITHYKEMLSKSDASDRNKSNEILWSEKVVTSATIFGSASVFNSYSSTSINQISDSILSDSSHLKEYIEQLFPLLLQIWIEAGPTSLTYEMPGNDDSGDVMNTMYTVIRVLCLIMECVDVIDDNISVIKWIKKTYLKKSLHHFVPTLLDLDCEQIQKDKSKRKNAQKDSEYVSTSTMNLMKCDFLRNFIDCETIVSSSWYSIVLKCVKYVLSMKNHRMQTNELHIVLRVLRRILNVETKEDITKEILDALFSYYCSLPTLVSQKMIIIKFICIILVEDGAIHLKSHNSINNFMNQLPEFLLQSMEYAKPEVINKLIKNMCKLCTQQHDSLLNSLQTNCAKYLNSSNYNQLASWNTQQQKSLIELLFWLPNWQMECFSEVCLLNYHNIIKFDSLKYLLEILAFKYNHNFYKKDEDLSLDHNVWMSFLFALILGVPLEEMRDSEQLELVLDGNFFMGWDLKYKKTNMICSILKQAVNSDQVAFMYEGYVLKLLDIKKKLPLSSAIAVLICLFSTHEKAVSSQSQKKLYCFISNKIFSSFLIDFIKDILLMLCEVRSSENQEIVETITHTTLETIAEIVGRLLGAMKSFVTKMMSCIESLNDFKVQSLVMILTKFISYPFVRNAINKSSLQMEISKIEVVKKDIISNQWWSNFKYAASIL